MHPVLLAHAGNFVAQQTAVQAHWCRPYISHNPVNFHTRNVALLGSDFVAFRITPAFLALVEISSAAVEVRISAQAEHLWRKHPRDARAIIDAMPDAMARIKFVGHRDAVHRVVRTVLGENSGDRLLKCVVKFVPAALARTGADEAWLLTAHFIRKGERNRLLRRGEIRPVIRSDP